MDLFEWSRIELYRFGSLKCYARPPKIFLFKLKINPANSLCGVFSYFILEDVFSTKLLSYHLIDIDQVEFIWMVLNRVESIWINLNRVEWIDRTNGLEKIFSSFVNLYLRNHSLKGIFRLVCNPSKYIFGPICVNLVSKYY